MIAMRSHDFFGFINNLMPSDGFPKKSSTCGRLLAQQKFLAGRADSTGSGG